MILMFILRFLLSKRFMILLIVILNARDFIDHMISLKVKDIQLDHIFGKSLVKQCNYILANVEYDEANTHNILGHLISRFGSHRHTAMFQSKINQNDKIIAKSYPKSMEIMRSLTYPLNREYLRKEYMAKVFKSDLHICPHESVQQFVNFFTTHSGHNETAVWLFLLTNPQVLIHPYLQAHGFPVPPLFGICGLTIFQMHVGQTLQHFYEANFDIKLRIAKQLLEAALKFTNGFEGFRMYITDITADNLIYNVERDKLYFIDLNTAYIVHAGSTTNSDDIDQHENIACDDCFAFVPIRLCTYGISDMNLLESCRFLREDLKRDRTKGFLKPIPTEITTKYTDLETLLDNCVDGGIKTEAETIEENSRFLTTLKLIELISNILNEF
uniref:UPF0672 protein C3orf58 homolog n=1 Tax=Zeugodacus cucurbitae TaxID=28588 RepID=A0A0A1WJ15_ZEUCU